MGPSTVRETISVLPWYSSACRIRDEISSGLSIMSPRMVVAPRDVYFAWNRSYEIACEFYRAAVSGGRRQQSPVHEAMPEPARNRQGSGLDVGREVAVAVVERSIGAHDRQGVAQACRGFQRAMEIDPLAGGQQLDRDNPRGVFRHVEKPPGGVGRHADIVL